LTRDSAGEQRNIGIFGGTFDPVHEGHVLLAEYILEQGIVESILFLPAACPPHKDRAAVSFFSRLSMLETAIAGNPAMAVSNLESRRSGPSYTVDSLTLLQEELPGSTLFFLLGADSLLELHLWYRFSIIFTLADLIVVARSGLVDEHCFQALRNLPGKFTPASSSCRLWINKDGARVWYLSGFSSPYSSTAIRQQLINQSPPLGVSPEVLSYIKKNALYC
jgi:nicotinate-nucleotide adenylyltransferase